MYPHRGRQISHFWETSGIGVANGGKNEILEGGNNIGIPAKQGFRHVDEGVF